MSKPPNNTLFLYQGNKLITLKESANHRSIFRAADMLLADQQSVGGSGLLATTYQGSVLAVHGEDEDETHRYSAYGHDPTLPSARTLLGFNGERLETHNGCQMLGNGYRAYSPRLMRFLATDTLSPFAQGGLNAYAYCQGDPVNFFDPSGHVRSIIANLKNVPRIQIEVDHPRKIPTDPSGLIDSPGNTANYRLTPKTRTTTFHRETLYEFEINKSKAYINKHDITEYLINTVELKQLTAPQHSKGPKPVLTSSVAHYLNHEIRSRLKRNETLLKLGKALYIKAIDPDIKSINIRGDYTALRRPTAGN